MLSGKMQNARIIRLTIPYDSFRIRFTSDITFSWCPSPMMLLTRVLHVAENAESTTHMSPDTLLVMFDIASARSPRCSMYMKNMNHVVIETVCWIMVHEHTGIIPLSS